MTREALSRLILGALDDPVVQQFGNWRRGSKTFGTRWREKMFGVYLLKRTSISGVPACIWRYHLFPGCGWLCTSKESLVASSQCDQQGLALR